MGTKYVDLMTSANRDVEMCSTQRPMCGFWAARDSVASQIQLSCQSSTTDVTYSRFLAGRGNQDPLGMAETSIASWGVAACSAPYHHTVGECNPLEHYQHVAASAAAPQLCSPSSEVGMQLLASYSACLKCQPNHAPRRSSAFWAMRTCPALDSWRSERSSSHGQLHRQGLASRHPNVLWLHSPGRH